MPKPDELPEEVDRRLGEIETAIDALEERPIVVRSRRDRACRGVRQHRAAAGVCGSSAGYVRPEDERAIEPAA